MSITEIDAQDLREMLDCVGRRIEKEEVALNALDSAVGDGDHGITMRLGFEAARNALYAMPPDSSISGVFDEAGRAFMNSTGGAIGVILGSMLMAGGKGLAGVKQMGPAEFKSLLDAMERGVVKTGKAEPGDKTLLDALHAACLSLSSIPGNAGLEDSLSRAADAAEVGAKSTTDMPCRKGRASRLGERALGHLDPGAVSFSLIMRSMADWVKDKGISTA